MKRSWFSIAAVLALIMVVSVASAQQQPSGTSSSPTSSTTSGTSSDMNAQSQSTHPSTTPATTEASTTENSTSKSLPSTASPMPLVGVIGLLTLAAGLWVARVRQKRV